MQQLQVWLVMQKQEEKRRAKRLGAATDPVNIATIVLDSDDEDTHDHTSCPPEPSPRGKTGRPAQV